MEYGSLWLLRSEITHTIVCNNVKQTHTYMHIYNTRLLHSKYLRKTGVCWLNHSDQNNKDEDFSLNNSPEENTSCHNFQKFKSTEQPIQ